MPASLVGIYHNIAKLVKKTEQLARNLQVQSENVRFLALAKACKPRTGSTTKCD
jgi:hypothetical protein